MDGSPGHPPLLSHSSWALTSTGLNALKFIDSFKFFFIYIQPKYRIKITALVLPSVIEATVEEQTNTCTDRCRLIHR